MIPPLIRICPECRHVGRTGRFEAEGDRGLACPRCGHRFEGIERVWLN